MALEGNARLGVLDQREIDEVKESKSTEQPKPWKVKKKPWKRDDASSKDIEIYESKVVTVGVRDIEVTSPETGYLCIRCQGDEEFYIPSHVVDCFQCVDIILHGDGESKPLTDQGFTVQVEDL